MGDSPLVLDWIAKAETDLKCAKILFEHDGGNEVVAFHCQQAIEKALKAIILYLYATLESGHSLLYLCKKVIEKIALVLSKFFALIAFPSFIGCGLLKVILFL